MKFGEISTSCNLVWAPKSSKNPPALLGSTPSRSHLTPHGHTPVWLDAHRRQKSGCRSPCLVEVLRLHVVISWRMKDMLDGKRLAPDLWSCEPQLDNYGGFPGSDRAQWLMDRLLTREPDSHHYNWIVMTCVSLGFPRLVCKYNTNEAVALPLRGETMRSIEAGLWEAWIMILLMTRCKA